MSIRTIIFFAIGAAVFVAVNITMIISWLRERKILSVFITVTRLKHAFSIGLHQAAIAVFLLVILAQTMVKGGILKFNVVEHTYPDSAINFIKQSNIKGRMFNTYKWGGYLIWKLPEYQVFIDGRCLNETTYFHYNLLRGAVEGDKRHDNRMLWKYLLDEYQIEFILTDALSSNGRVVPLTFKLMSDPEWLLIYQDGTALIFIRDKEENRRLFGTRILDKSKAVLDEIVSESLAGIRQYPATWEYYFNLGSIYMQRYQIQDARVMFEKYLSMNPNNRLVIQNLNFIRGLSGEKPLPVPEESIPAHNF